MKNRFSIKQRLIVLPLVLVFSAVTVISILSWKALVDIAHVMRVNEMENNTRFIADMFASSQRNLMEMSKLIAGNGSLTEAIYYYVEFGGEREPINKELQEIFRRNPADLMMVTDADGLGLAYNDDLGRFNFPVPGQLLGEVLKTRMPDSDIKVIDGRLMIVTTIPIFHRLGDSVKLVGAFINGQTINAAFLNGLKGATHIELASYHDARVDAATTPLLTGLVMHDQDDHGAEDGEIAIESFQPEAGVSMDISHVHLRSEEKGEVLGYIVVAVHSEHVTAMRKAATAKILLMSLLVVAGVGIIGWRTGRGIVARVLELVTAANELSRGNMSARVNDPGTDEIGRLGTVFNDMVEQMAADYWLKEQTARISNMVQESVSQEDLASAIISHLTPLLEAGVGLFFIQYHEGSDYSLQGSYCFQQEGQLSFAPGESLVGQCAVENRVLLLSDFPEGYVKINSAVGEGTPREILVIPVGFRDNVVAVMEIASFTPFSQKSRMLIDEVVPIIGLGLGNLMRNRA